MTDKAEDVVARLKSWATGSYDVELASARINVRDVRDALALIASQAAEIERLRELLQSAYVRSSIEEGSPLGVEVCSYLRGYIP